MDGAKKLLVVDDSPAAREKLAVYFEQNGFEVVRASDGADAVRQLKLHPDVALVLMDLEMPLLTGFELLRLMRRGGIAPDVPVLALTGAYKDPATIARLKDEGATGYINKDVELPDVMRRVERILYPAAE
jgi:CheY-like chemotaxis protein